MKCPICEQGTLHQGEVQEEMFGVALGTFPALVCPKCGESFTDERTTKLITAAAKRKGLWGLERKTTVTKSGNSLAVRIPKQLAEFLHLKEGADIYGHPDKNRLVIEAA